MVLHFFSIFYSLFLKSVLSRSTDAFQTPPEGQRASMDFRQNTHVEAFRAYLKWLETQNKEYRYQTRKQMLEFLENYKRDDPIRRRQAGKPTTMRRKRRPVRRG